MSARVSPTTRGALRKGVGGIGYSFDQLAPIWRRFVTRGLTVFIFHEITATPSRHQIEGRIYTSPDCFEQQLEWITNRFVVVPPTHLPALGGEHNGLPANAALVTFDDAWAGVFRDAIPILRRRGIPALCFVNMGTIAGDPDLAVVRRYEHASGQPSSLDATMDRAAGQAVIDRLCERYAGDRAFLDFQGPTATTDDLARTSGDLVWLGSHLYHHWDLERITDDLYMDSFEKNADALRGYPNALPAFATPHGFAGEGQTDASRIPLRAGARVVFTGTGAQNRSGAGRVLDRVSFPPAPCTARDWWFATHRRRLLGTLVS